MKAVAFIELLILLRVTIGAILFQNSLLMPVIYVHFVRQRYYQSPFTRSAVTTVHARVEGYVRQPGVPPLVVKAYDVVLMLINKWGGVLLAPNPPPAAAAAAQ